jgi:hypothetical protein
MESSRKRNNKMKDPSIWTNKSHPKLIEKFSDVENICSNEQEDEEIYGFSLSKFEAAFLYSLGYIYYHDDTGCLHTKLEYNQIWGVLQKFGMHPKWEEEVEEP